jgi:hypothetical protein
MLVDSLISEMFRSATMALVIHLDSVDLCGSAP